jgi:hypothetical protein
MALCVLYLQDIECLRHLTTSYRQKDVVYFTFCAQLVRKTSATLTPLINYLFTFTSLQISKWNGLALPLAWLATGWKLGFRFQAGIEMSLFPTVSEMTQDLRKATATPREQVDHDVKANLHPDSSETWHFAGLPFVVLGQRVHVTAYLYGLLVYPYWCREPCWYQILAFYRIG